jgi:acetyl coenzyme A synthetase (ADP forming)-like protein
MPSLSSHAGAHEPLERTVPPLKRHPLDPIFRPRSVAVIGASRQASSIGREIIRNLLEFDFSGKVFPVNPKADVVASMKCYRSIADIPDEVDLAVLVVPRAVVPAALRECGRKGVKGVVTITAGFKEVGPEGAALERRLVRILHRHGMRMVGPNCMGVINTEPEVRLNATFAASRPQRGVAAFVSQSGALGEAILTNARSLGLGIAMFVSMGNKTDISGNDLLEYWENDPDVRLILMYLESFGNPAKFARLARRITRAKPILAVKSGRSEAGARAASSHTGSIVGRDLAVESLLDQSGVLRVSSMEELFTLATSFALQPVPKGNRIGIVTNAGGPGILATDASVAASLVLPPLAARTTAALRRILPPEATVGNPVDLIASATPERFEGAIRALIADPGIDSVIAIFVSPVIVNPGDMARAIVRAAKGARKTVVSCFMGKEGAEGPEIIREAGIPLGAMNRYRLLRDRPIGKVPRFPIGRVGARAALASRGPEGWLPGPAVESLLRAAGLPVAPSRLARTAEEAIRASHEIGYPVVLKAESARLLHKSDLGGVKIDLRNADEVYGAFQEIQRGLGARDPSLRAKVQPMIRGGREVILGMSRDPQYDVAVRVHPITDVQAREMITSIRGYPLLAGARGERPCDIAALEDGLLKLSCLVAEFQDIEEIDINPFIVATQPGKSLIVDARVRVARRAKSAGGTRAGDASKTAIAARVGRAAKAGRASRARGAGRSS